MTDPVSELFVRLTELADALGAIPDDGSGINGVWTVTIPSERERDWNVALNADVDTKHTVDGFPGDEDKSEVPAGRAVIYLGRMPAGMLGPFGGQCVVETDGGSPESIEDELIAAVENAIDCAEVIA